jgi:hypothetical protein
MQWSLVMDNWTLDGTSFGKWQFLQHLKSLQPIIFYKEWQRMLGSIMFGDDDPNMCSLQEVLSKTKGIGNAKSEYSE